MNNLGLYEKFRKVPEEAKKPIKGGRLSGMTDINPMWRIKTLTEQFGPCGTGWKLEIRQIEYKPGAHDTIAVFVHIDLYYKDGGNWSEPIPGTGGSMFVAKETSGLYTSDEAVKMAYTDAISVACKLLGIGADVYWQGDRTKYDTQQGEAPKATQTANNPTATVPIQPLWLTLPPPIPPIGEEIPFIDDELPFNDEPKATEPQLKKIYAMSKSLNLDTDAMVTIMLERYTKENSKELTKKEASDLIGYLDNK